MRLPLPARFIRVCNPNTEGRAEIGTRQIYIFPTGFGFLFAILLFIMLIGSINFANNLGFLLTFLLAGLGPVAMIHTWRNLLGTALALAASPPTFKGESATYHLVVINGRGAERPAIRLEFDRKNITEWDLSADDCHNLTLYRKASKRGWQPIPRVVVSTQYPLGLFTAWSYVQLDANTLVYPAPSSPIELEQMPTYKQSRQGDKGIGVEDFVGLRAYRQGDSPRHINWKAVAREQPLQTKQFAGDRAEQLWLDWNTTNPGDVEQKLSQLCRGVLDSSQKELEYGLRLPDQEISPAQGIAQKIRCLSALALFGESP